MTTSPKSSEEESSSAKSRKAKTGLGGEAGSQEVGEGGWGSFYDSVYQLRPPKKLGQLGKERFNCFECDQSNLSMKPYLLDLTSLYLTDLNGIEKYKHITYLNLIYNKLDNSGILKLDLMVNLLTLILDHNKIRSTLLPKMPKLIYLSLNKNLLTTIEGFYQPNVEFIFLNENSIQLINNVNSTSIPKLILLSISRCRLVSMVADYAPTIQYLYLSYNKIKQIESLDFLVNLKVLHLRGNRISKLRGFKKDLTKLHYINLRETEISDGNELKSLKILPLLRTLILTDTPLDKGVGQEDLRETVLVILPELRRINKELVDEEEREKAKILIEKEREEQERIDKLGQLRGEEYGGYSDLGTSDQEDDDYDDDEDDDVDDF